MEKYNKYVADNPKVALVFVSHDKSRKSAEKWAAKAGMPWLTVLPQNVSKSKLDKYYPGAIPSWVLLDKGGKKISSGPGVFKKSAELTGKEEE